MGAYLASKSVGGWIAVIPRCGRQAGNWSTGWQLINSLATGQQRESSRHRTWNADSPRSPTSPGVQEGTRVFQLLGHGILGIKAVTVTHHHLSHPHSPSLSSLSLGLLVSQVSLPSLPSNQQRRQSNQTPLLLSVAHRPSHARRHLLRISSSSA